MTPASQRSPSPDVAVAIVQAFAEKGWPEPTFSGRHVHFAGMKVSLAAFEAEFEKSLSLCTVLLTEAPERSSHWGVVGAPRHEYTRGPYRQHISEPSG